MRRGWLCLLWLALCALPACAEELSVCYHYGCDQISTIEVGEETLGWMNRRLLDAASADEERAALQDVVLAYYQLAAQTTPIAADRAGNHEDARILGRMDCVDHSRNIDQLLELLDAHHWLHYHHVAGIVYRAPLLLDQHFAVGLDNIDSAEHWVIDSWPRDFGAPPLVVPLALWKEGFSP
ncbi:hypothetical protein [Vogesella sp. LIG4]|uniref:hypothetical protein n=1 Tax=Vogesella sp. LIG4 TaxID=1192162 RepID=UPI00081FCAB4|nr:hypothetical protein [Vogesella sp. LIG4]SCK20020.1 hypothetical protein PSELUDRAFT_2209 [Vogesella sp. LIG4]